MDDVQLLRLQLFYIDSSQSDLLDWIFYFYLSFRNGSMHIFWFKYSKYKIGHPMLKTYNNHMLGISYQITNERMYFLCLCVVTATFTVNVTHAKKNLLAYKRQMEWSERCREIILLVACKLVLTFFNSNRI